MPTRDEVYGKFGEVRLSEVRGRLPGTHKATPPKQLHRLPAG